MKRVSCSLELHQFTSRSCGQHVPCEGKSTKLQQPMKELEIGTVQMEEQGTLVIEANGKGEDASQVNPEFGEDAKLIQGPKKIEYDQ